MEKSVISKTFITGNDRYSGHGYSGIDRYSGTKTPDDAILFTVSGITAIVEQKCRKFRVFPENFDADLSKYGILKLIKLQKTSFWLFFFYLAFKTGHLFQIRYAHSLKLSKSIAANKVRIQF